MVLWIILGMGWLAILFAGITLFRLADYADKKVRRLAERPPATQKTSCLSIAHHKFFSRSTLIFRHIYCVVTIQRGATAWKKGEFVIRAKVPSEDLMPKAEMLEDPKLAT